MIRLLHLRNFKCFEDQALRLGSVTLLAGLNGMGKSSMLQVLLLLRQSHQQRLLETIGLALRGDLVVIGTARDALFEGAQEDRLGFAVDWDDDRRGNWLFNYNRDADVLELASKETDSVIYQTSLFDDRFQYLHAERIGPRVAFDMSDFLVHQHRQLGTRGEYTAHFLHAFGRDDIRVDALVHAEAVSRKLSDQVEAWLGAISPGVRLHFTPHADMDVVNLQYSFGQLGNPYRSTNVGFGVTYTLPVLVALLSSEAGSLVLLENPEAHLHPKGQVLMGDLIARAASGGVQVVVETHSDHVLNGIRLAVHSGRLAPEEVCLHFFQRHEQADQAGIEVISPRMDRNGRIDQWPEGFFDEWDKSLEALLTPRGA